MVGIILCIRKSIIGTSGIFDPDLFQSSSSHCCHGIRIEGNKCHWQNFKVWLQPLIGPDCNDHSTNVSLCCHGVCFESNNMPFAIYGLNSGLT